MSVENGSVGENLTVKESLWSGWEIWSNLEVSRKEEETLVSVVKERTTGRRED